MTTDEVLALCDQVENSEVDDLGKVRLARAVKAVLEEPEHHMGCDICGHLPGGFNVGLSRAKELILSAFALNQESAEAASVEREHHA